MGFFRPNLALHLIMEKTKFGLLGFCLIALLKGDDSYIHRPCIDGINSFYVLYLCELVLYYMVGATAQVLKEVMVMRSCLCLEIHMLILGTITSQ